MPVDMRSLSPNVYGKICKFVDKKSIFQLREVSEDSLENVTSLISAQKTTIDSWEVQTTGDYSTILFLSPKDCFVWKLCLVRAVKHLGMNINTIHVRPRRLDLEMSLEDLTKLLEFLKPLTENVIIKRFATFEQDPIRSEVVQVYSDFLEGRSIKVSIAELLSTTEDFDKWIRLLRIVECEFASFKLASISKDSFAFLKEVANKATSIKIFVQDLSSAIAMVVRELLSRKCETLTLELGQNIFLSAADVEALLKIFSNLQRKVSFYGPTNAPPMNERCGLFNVLIQNGSTISIRHVSMD